MALVVTMPSKKMCAWISRHAPTRAQRTALEGAGYRIFMVNPPERIMSARWAWAQSQTACGGIPALCVVVMPLGMLREFVRDYGEQTVVVRAQAARTGSGVHDWQWSGQWQRIKRVQTVTESWSPDGGEGG